MNVQRQRFLTVAPWLAASMLVGLRSIRSLTLAVLCWGFHTVSDARFCAGHFSGQLHPAACPVLNGLKREADENQGDAKDTHAAGGHMIGGPFDERCAGTRDCRYHPDGQSRFQPNGECVDQVVCHQAADIAGDRVADCPIHCREKLGFGYTRARAGTRGKTPRRGFSVSRNRFPFSRFRHSPASAGRSLVQGRVDNRGVVRQSTREGCKSRYRRSSRRGRLL